MYNVLSKIIRWFRLRFLLIKKFQKKRFTMDQNKFLNITKRVTRKTSVVQRWQEASEIYIDTEGKVIYPKYSKHYPYTVAHTINCECNEMLNHGLNHGLFFSLFKLLPCHIHWIVYVLSYLNFMFEFLSSFSTAQIGGHRTWPIQTISWILSRRVGWRCPVKLAL